MKPGEMAPGVLRTLQVALSTLAGFVDVVAYLSLEQSNVAFMSGNSTMLGMAAGGVIEGTIPVIAGMVACFVAGVVAGTLLGGTMRRLWPVGVLLLVAAALAVAAGVEQVGHRVGGVLLMAAALGALNTAFNRPGSSGVGLTYMTGTLVRFGQRLAAALRGGSWAPIVPELVLWAGLVGGAGLGAVGFRAMGLSALWLAVGACLLVAAVTRSALRGEQTVGA